MAATSAGASAAAAPASAPPDARVVVEIGPHAVVRVLVLGRPEISYFSGGALSLSKLAPVCKFPTAPCLPPLNLHVVCSDSLHRPRFALLSRVVSLYCAVQPTMARHAW